MTSSLTIGAVAKAAEVNVETIRYYQRLGLIEEPAKPLGGARRYTNGAVERVRFIKRAQQLGFSLNEIRRLLALGEAQSCGSARSLAEEKLGLVKARIADLERMRRALEDLIARCEVRRGKIACPIIATLSGEASLP
jgi:MerR family transcriptional regulator, mercuric resistance operon regulatory protein